MFVVAITELRAPAEAFAEALAPEIGVTAYEARLELAAGMPAVVLSTPDRDRAARLAQWVRARGHEAVAIDTAAVVGSERMVAMRRFRLDEGAIVAEDRGLELPYDEVFVLVRAQHRRGMQKSEEVKRRALSGARALMTGGMLLTRKVTEQVHVASEEREQVLYLYGRGGGVPWILHEANTSYAGLGAEVAPSQLESFNRTVRALRTRMPLADYDDRLLSLRRVRSKVSSALSRGTVETSSADWMDLMAHLVALAVARRKSDPYRS